MPDTSQIGFRNRRLGWKLLVGRPSFVSRGAFGGAETATHLFRAERFGHYQCVWELHTPVLKFLNANGNKTVRWLDGM